MTFLRKVLDFYLQGSLHVALSVFSLVKITQFFLHIQSSFELETFVFFASVTGYNFVKYADVNLRKSIRGNGIRLLTLITGLASVFFFLKLQAVVKMGFVFFGILTALYALPIIPKKVNLRNWAGIKIYWVSACWSGVTVLLPVLNAGISFTKDVWLLVIQRFILVFVLLLIFEIIDLRHDKSSLKTIPQQIGIRKTKMLGILLLLLFCGLEVFSSQFQFSPLLLKLLIIIVIAIFLAFANEKRSKYYTSFWVESIPVLWWLLLFLV